MTGEARSASSNLARRLTPLVDEALPDPLRVPRGVGEWLRRWERDIEAVRGDIAQELTSPVVVEVLREAARDVDALIDDSGQGAFARLLRRPLWQLEDQAGARASFDRRATGAVERAREAIEVQRNVVEASGQLAAIRETFAGRFPTFVQDALRRERAGEPELLAARRTQDVADFRRRLARAGGTLADLASAADKGARWMPTERDPEAKYSAHELAALVAIGLERRGRARRLVAPAARIGDALRHNLAGLGVSRPPRVAGYGAWGALADDMLVRSARLGGRVPLFGADAPLWVNALVGACDSGMGVGSEAARAVTIALPAHPAIRVGDEPPEGDTSSYIVPIGHDLVLVSQSVWSVIRVWSAQRGVGEEVDGRVIVSDIGEDPVDVADVTTLYEGVNASGPAWYRSQRRLQVRLVARAGNTWIGRIGRRGAFSRLANHPAWNPVAPQAQAFRLRVRPSPAGSAHAAPVEVQPVEDAGELAGFLGFRFREVATPFVGDEVAWLRQAPSTGAAQASAEREREALLVLQQAMPGQALTYIGRGKVAAATLPASLYRVPLASGPGIAGPVEAWMRESVDVRLAALAGIARIVRALHSAGWALGIVHPDAFAYRLSWMPESLLPSLDVTLVHAPCATRLGEPITTPDWMQPFDATLFRRLGVPVLNPVVASGAAASEATDAYALGVCALNLIATKSLADPGEQIAYFDLPRMVQRRSERFAFPGAANMLAVAMWADGTGARLGRWAKWLGEVAAGEEAEISRVFAKATG